MKPHLRICLGRNPFTKGYQGYIISILMLMIDSYIEFLGFHSQDNYLPRDRKMYRSFLSMWPYSHHPLIQIFSKIWKRADMTSWLIESGSSDCSYCPVRAKVEYCKSCDLLGYQVMSCSATSILFSSMMGHHPRLAGSLIGEWGLTPKHRCSWYYLPTPPLGQDMTQGQFLSGV